ncbi:MAG: hypothetical protein R3Y46_00790 [Opitutales bacterium]
MKKFLIIISIIFTSLFAFANSDNQDTLALIDKVQHAHSEQSKETKTLYLELAQKLDTHIAKGEKNANIYTMQGNAYLFADKIGMAIYAYKNALKYAHNDEEIFNNLDYARSLCVTQLNPSKKTSLIEDYFYEASFTKNNALWIFLLSWNLIFIIPLLKTKITEIKFLWIISIAFASIFGSALLYQKYVELNNKEGIVITKDTIARKGASDIFLPAYKETLKDGTEFVILGKKKGWLHAKLKDGTTSWIDEKATIEL